MLKDKMMVGMIKFEAALISKLRNEDGDENLNKVGWAFVAVLIVLAVAKILPGQITGFLGKIFTKFETGLGIE